MICISDKRDCCGCTACANICRQHAISMVKDELGFYYPETDHTKCNNCGLCQKVCKFNAKYDEGEEKISPICYGARHKNIDEVNSSRSGAVFIAISDEILNKGGVVYGVGFRGHFIVAHKRALCKEERNEFKGSKYVQSDTTGIFLQVRHDLEEGKKVLFTGTPCQTAALRSYISKKLRGNLYLLDIVCHGVPSPALWKDYITWLEGKYHTNIISVNFRDKHRFSWVDHRETFKTERGNIENENLFSYLFCNNFMLRPSCENCYYSNTIRPSDITIGDFWGYEKSSPNANYDGKGVSLILVNTEKGRELFCNIQDQLDTFNARLQDCLQPNLCNPTTANPKNKSFFNDYIEKGFAYVAQKYGNISFSYKLRSFLKRVINYVKKRISIK